MGVAPRGGGRYVEGYWGFPYLKIEKFVGFTTFPFHVFDRYDIHIQDFEEVFTGLLSFSVPIRPLIDRQTIKNGHELIN